MRGGGAARPAAPGLSGLSGEQNRPPSIGGLAPYAGKAADLVAPAPAPQASAPSPVQLPYVPVRPAAPFPVRAPVPLSPAVEPPPEASVAPQESQHGADLRDEQHLAEEAINALNLKPEAMGAIIQRTHEIAQARGWDPSVIGNIIGAKMQQPQGMGEQL